MQFNVHINAKTWTNGLNLLWHCPLYATASDVDSWRQARFRNWHSERYVLPSLPHTARWYWWSLSNIFCEKKKECKFLFSLIRFEMWHSAAHYQWHIDWRIWNIVPIESWSYSIFPRGIRLIVSMRCTLIGNMLIVSMFAAMPHIAMVICLGFVVQRRRWQRRLNAYTIFSKSMTILWRRWYDRNDFIFFWHRRIFIKTTSGVHDSAVECGNWHIDRGGRMPTAIPLISFVCISVDVSTWFLCIVCQRFIVGGDSSGEMMVFCVMLIRFAFRRTNTLWFAATHYASLLWTAFGCGAWI